MKKIKLLLILPLFVNAKINTSHFETIKTINIPNCTNVIQLDYGNSPNTYNDSFPVLIEGCMDSNASNYDSLATVQGYDQYNNLQCVYASCDDIPEWGCIYNDGFGPFNADFNAVQCSEYGGSPCEEPVCPDLDFTALNTGVNMSIYLNLYSVSIDLADGDMIGVFFTNEAGDLVCAGSSAWTGSLLQFSAFGDDPLTYIKDGFSTGDSIVWKTETSSGVYDIVPTYDNGDGTYIPNGLILINDSEFVYSCTDTLSIGCTDETAINYDPNAEQDDGSCIATVVGCMDTLACNFDSTATIDNETCEYAVEYYDCDGVCLDDYDNDGVCDEIDYDDGLDIDDAKELKHRIYPNPVENKLSFSHNHKKEVLDIQIYNTIGLLIYEDRIKTAENDVTIDVKNLSPGMYMIKISNGKNSSSTTWIKK